MIKFFLLLSLFMMSFISNGQEAKLTTYDSYEEFQNDKGTLIGNYIGCRHAPHILKLVAKQGSKKVRISFGDIWGFTIDDDFYRVYSYNYNDVPIRLISVSEGEIYYYENGFAHLNIRDKNKKRGKFDIGSYCYISKDINSEPIELPKMSFTHRKKMNALKKEHPEYAEIFDCIYKSLDYQDVLPCINKKFDTKQVSKDGLKISEKRF